MFERVFLRAAALLMPCSLTLAVVGGLDASICSSNDACWLEPNSGISMLQTKKEPQRGRRDSGQKPKSLIQQQSLCQQKNALVAKIGAISVLESAGGEEEISGCPPTKFIDPVRTRKELGSLLNDLNLTGVGVEVGVQSGLYSYELLKKWKQASLFVQVDLWKRQQNYSDVANVANPIQQALQSTACLMGLKAVGAGYAKSVLQCKDYSTECAKLFPDKSLDFVYLDARHDRKGVLEDLISFWPKLRNGGVMAGHDYLEQDEPYANMSPKSSGQDWTIQTDGSIEESGRAVRGAVNDFFSGVAVEAPKELQKCPRQPVITYREAEAFGDWYSFNTWVVRK